VAGVPPVAMPPEAFPPVGEPPVAWPPLFEMMPPVALPPELVVPPVPGEPPWATPPLDEPPEPPSGGVSGVHPATRSPAVRVNVSRENSRTTTSESFFCNSRRAVI
jgi:hypothetical protein